MEIVRKYLVQIKSRLVGLTISQKLLIGLLVIVMLATIFFTVVFSAKPTMVPLIAQSMTPEEINRVEMAIKEKYTYQVAGDKVLVPAEQAYAIRGALASEQALPKDLSTAFTHVIANSSPFATSEMNTRAWNNALQEELTRFLCGFPYIEYGSVIIAHGQPAGLGKPALPSTATVTVKVKNSATLTASQVRSIAEMVSGAVAGMRREDVHVVDGQRAYHVQSSDMPMPTELIEYKRNMEEDYTQKLFNMFNHYGDVKIAVNVMPDYSNRVRDTESFDPKTTVVRDQQTTSREVESSEGAGAEGQPGVPPNTSISLADANTNNRRQSSSTKDNSVSSVVKVGSVRERQTIASGTELKQLTASLSFPRSYFVAVWQKNNRSQGTDGKALEPTDAELNPILEDRLKSCRETAMNSIGAKSPDQIRCDWYDDTIIMRPEVVALAATGFTGDVKSIATQWGKTAFLLVVAASVLTMMIRMVKQAVPTADSGDLDPGVFFSGAAGAGGKRRKGEVGQLDSGDDVFGEANEGEAVLTGIELNDEDVQSRKMVDEVSTMVKENPENAAALVKRWMTKGK